MEEGQISVWVCREEKLVLGLTKRTSCSDVVQVLLEEQEAASAAGASAYCIVEKWRGFERILPNRTKIYRLWQAWGDERSNVKFVLLKSEASLANRGARCAEARVVLSKRSPTTGGGGSAARAPLPAAGISPEKQRRVVRKAFRKLERMNKRKKKAAAVVVHLDAERMETLVHVVVSQDLTLRQQLHRIGELDGEIERCEADVHRDRVKRHGVNYVQDTYLLVEGERDDACVKTLEEVARLHEELREQEALIDVLTAEIQEELNRRWMLRREEEEVEVEESGATDLDVAAAVENGLILEGERVRTQLDASSYIGLRLNTDLETIGGELELSQRACADREREMRDLEERVETLELEEEAGMKVMRRSGEQQGKSGWVEQARGLSTAQDDDSDTGLSSLHSQDSDCQTVWESLV